LKQQQPSAAIYCRLSRDDGFDSESNSIGNQREMLQRYCAEKGFPVYKVYADDSLTAKILPITPAPTIRILGLFFNSFIFHNIYRFRHFFRLVFFVSV
jgi:hypothetical protein